MCWHAQGHAESKQCFVTCICEPLPDQPTEAVPASTHVLYWLDARSGHGQGYVRVSVYLFQYLVVLGMCRDMLVAHNALLHVYASHGQTHKAKQLYASMQERGPATDRISASILIAALAKVHILSSAVFSLHTWCTHFCGVHAHNHHSRAC